MVQDNGGAIAQRGFNYQNHVISLVAIRNYCKNKFEIYVESDDDFEVVYDDNYHAYIQVKGMKRVSITRLLQKEKDNCSIFEKHFTSGDQHSKYKIVVFHFNQAELLKMNVNTSEELFERSWKFSAEQTNEILAKLGADFGAKLDNFSLVKTAFCNDFSEARTYLKGELITQEISVDGRDDIILDELDRLIKQKSEYIIKNEDDKKLKRISAVELKPILKKISSKALFESELDKFPFTPYKKAKIKKEEVKIILNYMYDKRQVIGLLESDKDRLETKHLIEIAEEIINCDILQHLDYDARYAIVISAYCDIIEGVANEPINHP
jgi:hypothetical protein